MNLDTSGALLENIRFSTGNNTYSFPPYDLVTNSSAFSGISERAEYAIVVGSSSSSKSLQIADVDLVFYWSRNEPGVTRFDYDNFSGRWLPMPGSAPRIVGILSNSPRLTIPVPDPTRAASAPFDLYVDDTPRISFLLSFIGSGGFSDPGLLPALTVEVNSSGALNFSAIDLIVNADREVSFTGQSFTPRAQAQSIGALPDFATTDYRIFLSPRPASGQVPRIRIGFGPHLASVEVSSESALTPPPAGTVYWSADTGRLKFAVDDVSANLGESIYYDGVFLGQKQFTRYGVSAAGGWPGVAFNIPAAIGTADSQRFVLFADKAGNARRYFSPSLFKSSEGSPSSPPTSGWFYLDADTGNFYLSASDVASFSSWTLGCIDARLEIGAPGVGVQMRRSGVNGSGEASVPDFTIVYEVSQMLSDNLDSSPFMMLPTVPLVDSYLNFQVDMGTGSFVGQLSDSSNSSEKGPGYLLELSTKQLKYTYRASPVAYALPQDQSSIKLEGAALSSRGVVVKRNGAVLSVSEYDLDTSSGLIEFVEPVGEGDSSTREVSGTASGSTFVAQAPSFVPTDSGKRLLIASGPSSGIYDISAVNSDVSISVSEAFAASGSVAASVRATDEIIADRFWTPVSSVPKKFSLYRSPTGPAGTFAKAAVGEYSVKPNVGAVGLSTPASPGEAVKIEYVSLDSADEGVTAAPTSRTEMALFKIAQEAVVFSVGSKVMTFNAAGKTVDTSRPMVLYIEGVTQDPTDYAFTAPGTIVHRDAVAAGPVTIDYWVQEASGGETSFDLLHSPIDYDSLKVTGPIPGGASGQTSMAVSGDQTGALKARCALLLEDQDMLYISASSYDAATDLTTVSFNQAVVSDSENIKVTGIINNTKAVGGFHTFTISEAPYLIDETNATEIFVSGTNSVRMHGDAVSSYRPGTVIDFDGDPYWVRGAAYDGAAGITTITTSGSARRNYITPSVKRSIRPVLNPLSEFSTLRPAHISRGFVLAKMGSAPSVLQEGVDYTLGDGGIIKLKTPIAYGDMLRAMYVARVAQPAGTVFEFNFAHQIAPDNSNGLAGQKLTMNYNLFAPDTFFYRVETVVSMLPEAKAAMTSGSTATSSGPNIASMPSQQTKDAGLPSPWYDSSHYGNIDVVVQRFLKYYHDLIELYEDVLSCIDGRIVGGSSGRFRYDGVLGRVVADNSQIKNDIDDSAILYNEFVITGFGIPPHFSTIPVYGKMSDTNNLSRIFPTVKTGAAFIIPIDGSTANGQQVGSYKIQNIVSAGTTTTARAVAFFTSSAPITGGTQFVLDSLASAPELTTVLTGGASSSGTNGDPNALVPSFLTGQKIQVFNLDGVQIADGVVGTVDPTSPHILPTTASTTEQIGSIVQTQADFEGDANQQNLYAPGTDYLISADTGQIVFFKMPAGFPFQNNPLKGSETIESSIVFGNSSTKPERIPALDGQETNDSGRLSIPRVRLACELRYLLQELSALKLGSAQYPGYGLTLTDVSLSSSVSIGQSIQFIDGPNVGFSVNVTGHVGTSLSISSSLPNPDPGSNFIIGSSWANMSSTLSGELAILNKEIARLDSAIDMFGVLKLSGSGFSFSTSTWTDGSTSLLGTEGMLLRITSGTSAGLYKIESATAHSVTISSSPYPQLILGSSGTYSIVEPWAFLKEAEFQFVAGFYRSTLSFLQSTAAWSASPTASGVGARVAAAQQRQIDLAAVIGDSGSLTGLLKNGDNLYDTRYMWIDQRTNRESGMVQLQARALQRAVEILTKVVEDQRKAFMMDTMAAMT